AVPRVPAPAGVPPRVPGAAVVLGVPTAGAGCSTCAFATASRTIPAGRPPARVTWSVPVVVGAKVPIDIGRDQAAAAAQAELAKPAYAAGRPSAVEQLTRWLDDLIARAIHAVDAVAPGGIGGLVVLAAVVVLIVVLVRWRVGPLRRTDAA